MEHQWRLSHLNINCSSDGFIFLFECMAKAFIVWNSYIVIASTIWVAGKIKPNHGSIAEIGIEALITSHLHWDSNAFSPEFRYDLYRFVVHRFIKNRNIFSSGAAGSSINDGGLRLEDEARSARRTCYHCTSIDF